MVVLTVASMLGACTTAADRTSYTHETWDGCIDGKPVNLAHNVAHTQAPVDGDLKRALTISAPIAATGMLAGGFGGILTGAAALDGQLAAQQSVSVTNTILGGPIQPPPR